MYVYTVGRIYIYTYIFVCVVVFMSVFRDSLVGRSGVESLKTQQFASDVVTKYPALRIFSSISPCFCWSNTRLHFRNVSVDLLGPWKRISYQKKCV